MAFLLPHEILTESDKELIDSLSNQEGALIRSYEKYFPKLESIKNGIEDMFFYIEDSIIFKDQIEVTDARLKELHQYEEELKYIMTHKIIFRSLYQIAKTVDEFYHRSVFQNEISIWDMKDFVEMINGYFEIDAEKSSYKLAWGWNHFQEKKYPKGYLCAIIKNHLKKYGKYSDEVMLMIRDINYCREHKEEYMESVKL